MAPEGRVVVGGASHAQQRVGQLSAGFASAASAESPTSDAHPSPLPDGGTAGAVRAARQADEPNEPPPSSAMSPAADADADSGSGGGSSGGDGSGGDGSDGSDDGTASGVPPCTVSVEGSARPQQSHARVFDGHPPMTGLIPCLMARPSGGLVVSTTSLREEEHTGHLRHGRGGSWDLSGGGAEGFSFDLEACTRALETGEEEADSVGVSGGDAGAKAAGGRHEGGG